MSGCHGHGSADHSQPHAAGSSNWVRWLTWGGGLALLGVIGYYALNGRVGGGSPLFFLLILACPLMHLFMGHGRQHGHQRGHLASQPSINRSGATAEEESAMGCCGGHKHHGHQGHGSAADSVTQRAVGQSLTCPVCGQAVDETHPRADYGGRTYYFKCTGCLNAFLADPARFAAPG